MLTPSELFAVSVRKSCFELTGQGGGGGGDMFWTSKRHPGCLKAASFNCYCSCCWFVSLLCFVYCCRDISLLPRRTFGSP